MLRVQRLDQYLEYSEDSAWSAVNLLAAQYSAQTAQNNHETIRFMLRNVGNGKDNVQKVSWEHTDRMAVV